MADNAAVVYSARDDLGGGGTYKVMLLGPSVTVDRTVDFASDLTSAEVAYSGYGRQTVTSTAYDATTGELTGDDVTFPALGTTGDMVGGAAVIRWSGSNATSPVIVIAQFDPDRECDGGDFDIVFPGGVIASHDDYDPDVPQALQTLTGANSWGNSSYWRDREQVRFAGTTTGGASGAVLGTLPSGYRPMVAEVLPVLCTDGTDVAWGTLEVATGGAVTPTYPAGFDLLYLSSVPSFRVA